MPAEQYWALRLKAASCPFRTTMAVKIPTLIRVKYLVEFTYRPITAFIVSATLPPGTANMRRDWPMVFNS